MPDDEGFLPSGSGVVRMESPWADAIEQVVERFRSELGDSLHSFYVRGSVASGAAVEGVSDLDTFAVLAPDGREIDPVRFDQCTKSLNASITARYPVTRVEFDLVPYATVTEGRGFYAFALKTESACVYGTDLSDVVAPFRLGPEVAFQTRFFRKHLETFRREYPNEPEEDKAEFVSWLARRFLRLGMELVMEDEGRYSRDLWPSYESFSAWYPVEAGSMLRALELAVDPKTTDANVRFMLEFGEWLAERAERKLAEWDEAEKVPGHVAG